MYIKINKKHGSNRFLSLSIYIYQNWKDTGKISMASVHFEYVTNTIKTKNINTLKIHSNHNNNQYI